MWQIEGEEGVKVRTRAHYTGSVPLISIVPSCRPGIAQFFYTRNVPVVFGAWADGEKHTSRSSGASHTYKHASIRPPILELFGPTRMFSRFCFPDSAVLHSPDLALVGKGA